MGKWSFFVRILIPLIILKERIGEWTLMEKSRTSFPAFAFYAAIIICSI